MRRATGIILAVLFLLSALGAAAEGRFTEGTYEGTANGFHGAIPVTVEVSESDIISVRIGENEETTGIGSLVFPILTESIVANQSLADVVTGATITSRATISAVEKALSQAVTSDDVLSELKQAPIATDKQEDTETDIVIVGAGLAGMNAAIKAYDAGARVILLEKNVIAGGAARLSAGGFLATGVKEYEAADQDSTDAFFVGSKTAASIGDANDVLRWFNIASGPVYNPDVLLAALDRSNEMQLYIRENGVTVTDPGYTQPKLAPIFRSLGSSHFGISIADEMFAAVNARDIDYRNRTRAVSLLQDEDGTVNGVVAENGAGQYEIRAKKVILATGGYAYDQELMSTYSAEWKDAFKIAFSGATGDGHRMSMEAGGHMIGGGVLDIYVLGYDPSLDANQPGWVSLFIDTEGKQIGACDEYYGTLSVKIQNRPDHSAYALYSSDNVYVQFDYESTEAVPAPGAMKVSDMDALAESGRLIKADTIEELAEKIGVDPQRLLRTIDEHNWYYDLQINDAWGTNASALTPIKTGPYYAGKIIPSVFGTIGGIEVNPGMEVIDAENRAIPNLYAVGELIFGNMFNEVYPMAGTGLGLALSTGYIAGEAAAAGLE